MTADRVEVCLRGEMDIRDLSPGAQRAAFERVSKPITKRNPALEAAYAARPSTHRSTERRRRAEAAGRREQAPSNTAGNG